MVDPAKRLDVEGVLQHPWMTSEDLGNVVLGKALEQMKKFNAKRVQGWHCGCTDGAKVTRNWKEVKCVAASCLWKRILYTDL